MNLGLLEYGIVIMAFVITYLATNRLIPLLIELKREVLDYHKEGKKFVAYPGGPAIILGLISALLVSIIITNDTELYRLEIKCNRCQNITEEIIERVKLIPRKTELKNTSCPSCKSMDNESAQQDIIDYIALVASQTGTKVEVISGKTEHGMMLTSLGRIGAILRYNPQHA